MNQLNEIVIDIQNNNLEEALQKILEYEQMAGESAELFNIKGVLALKTMEYNTAVACLEKAKTLDNNNVDIYYNLAYAYEKLGNLRAAIMWYKKSMDMIDILSEKVQIQSIIDDLLSKVSINNSDINNETIIIKDTSSQHMPEFYEDTYSTRKNMEDTLVGEDAPLVSIIIQAYNNLEKYTKTCVECVLKYTVGIDYELILVDNGSTDETFQYFKSIAYPKKTIIRVIKNLGLTYGSIMGFNNAKGKYIVTVHNDVYVTQNWLSNMLKCAESDEKIGMVNPVLDYASNLQTVDLGYKDFEDMQQKAAQYNISDPKKWEERLRLITLGTLYKKQCLDIIGGVDYGFMHDFVDDDISFRIRRAGYKTVLCKDTFISHAGKMNDKGSEYALESLQKGRQIFKKKYFGIDAWDDTVNFERIMMSLIDSSKILSQKKYNVLGIDVLCGTPILEVKNRLRNAGAFHTILSAFSTNAKYWLDLQTICEGKVEADRIEHILEYFEKEKYDYIVLGKQLNEYQQPYEVINNIMFLLNNQGSILLKIKNNQNKDIRLKIFGESLADRNNEIDVINIEEFNNFLKTIGGYIDNIVAERYIFDKRTETYINNYIDTFYNQQNKQEIYNSIVIKEFIVCIKRF